MFNCNGICSQCGRCGNVEENEVLLEVNIPKSFQGNKRIGFGIAIDIGTTTIGAALCDLSNSKIIDFKSASNPQRNFGGDVISRIAYARRGIKEEYQLKISLYNTINRIILSLLEDNNISYSELEDVVMCGNRTMTTILMSYDIDTIAIYPFKPENIGGCNITWELVDRDEKGKETLIGNIQVYVVATIGGNVGGDILAGVVSNNLDTNQKKYLFLDLGTNGEIVFSSDNKMYAFSTAAGPAFEGGNIENGMVARKGAIYDVEIKGDRIETKVIGDEEPRGICGSGLISLIGTMIKSSIIQLDGSLIDYDFFARMNPYSSLLSNLQEDKFILIKNNRLNKDIYISQRDIREFQLAKAAISGGIFLAISKVFKNKQIIDSNIDSKTDFEFDEIILAGGFGKNISKKSLVDTGILPNIDINKITFVGNSALSGCIMMLLDEREKERSISLREQINYIELADEENFNKFFIESMNFSKI